MTEVHRRHAMPFGAEIDPDGRTRFRLWAPSAARIDLELTGVAGATRTVAMPAAGDGWYERVLKDAPPGTRYRYRIDGALAVPDPASRFNPDDVHGASEVIDPAAYGWRDGEWRGRPWSQAVVYELHVGAFTRAGTFNAVEARLDEIARLGITAIELMPVADFPGRRGWGYDGVLPFAPDSAYGRPEALKHLVDAAHARGLMMLLDVVYNHFGPEGAYLHGYAQSFFTDRHRTPWGDAINFDGPGSATVREFFIQNALYWLEEFHFDGLRVDAVHAIRDDSPRHFIAEMSERIRGFAGPDRHVHVVLENHENEARFLARDPAGRPRQATAQWNDDLHHALHVLLTGERDGYYADYADQPVHLLGRCLAEGFGFQGEAYALEGGRPRGEPSRELPPGAFIGFLQNHDQVGNRAFGERIPSLAPPDALHAALGIVLLAPSPPMLFMGDEFAAAQPFLFFCDFGADLAAAVTAGRRREFARFAKFSDPDVRARIPDPNAAATFAASRLRWSDRRRTPHREHLSLVRRLLRTRHKEIVPLIGELRTGAARYEVIDGSGLSVCWPARNGRELRLLANMSERPLAIAASRGRARTLYRSTVAAAATAGYLEPWEVRWTCSATRRSNAR
jgi:maltooligosyltrehalose trehalohydrolase